MNYRRSLNRVEQKLEYACGKLYKKDLNNLDEAITTVEEYNKVFNLIRTKYVQLNIVKYSDYSRYVSHCMYFGIKESIILTEEEFDLIKEVIKNG